MGKTIVAWLSSLHLLIEKNLPDFRLHLTLIRMVLFVLRQCLPSAVCWQSISHCLNNKPFCNLVSRSMSINQKIAVNGANLYHERVGTGSHVVLLIPGAAGEPEFQIFI